MLMRTACLAILMTLGTASFGLSAWQEEPEAAKLTIGSAAPPLNIEHWVQDDDGNLQHVSKFEEGKVYLVEFWATWCGPCIASMPHISEMQDQFGDRGFQVISVSDEDLETVEEFLDKPVRGEDEMTYRELTSNYCLTADPDRSVHDDYMRAPGQNEIPTAFLVGKTGLIEWIGHPMDGLDKVVGQVLGDEWDREVFAVAFRRKQELRTLQSRLSSLMRRGNTDEAIQLLDEAIENHEDEATLQSLKRVRARILVTSGGEGAADAMRQLAFETDNAELLNQMAWSVVQRHDAGEEVSDELVTAAADATRKALDLAPQAGHIMDTLAHLEYMQGNLDKAIELSEKAVELAGDQFPEIAEFLAKLRKEKSGDEDD
jgi:thiol-disulfide isomerase/thioredoxin